jgi:hypothetical protein
MADEKIFLARAKLRQIAKANLLKMAFSQKEKLCLLGGGTCPFLLEYQCALFCVSETLRHGCQIEKLGLLSDENAKSEGESCQKAVKLAVEPCLPGLG